MRGQQVADLSGQLDVGGDEDDQVVTDPLEVGDEMRGEHHADPVFGDDLHEHLEELAPGQGIQAGHRLVEQEELGSFGDGQREGELGPLATGQRSRPAGGGRGRGSRSGGSASASSQCGLRRAPMRRCSPTDSRA